MIRKNVIKAIVFISAIFTMTLGMIIAVSAAPYYLRNSQELENFAKEVNGGKSYEGAIVYLDADVELTDSNLTIGKYGLWSNKYFKGTFDGQGHTVNVHINTKNNYAGLFGCIKNATIKNVTVNGSVVADNNTSVQSNATGGIVGYVNGNSKFENCTNNASVKGYGKRGRYPYVGGIAGCGDYSSFSNCTNNGDVSGLDSGAGGIAGYNWAMISNCTNTGNISSAKEDKGTGGILGCGISVEYCKNSGNISGVSAVAGIVGDLPGGHCYNSSNSGTITASKDYAGGIVGYYDEVRESELDFTNGVAMKECFNTGNVTGPEYIGGIVGCSYGKYYFITHTYNSGTISGTQFIGGLEGGYYDQAEIDPRCASYYNSYNIGQIYANTAHVGAITGGEENKRINCYSLKNCVYPNGDTTSFDRVGILDKDVIFKTDSEFASGEVCYKLNNYTGEDSAKYGGMSFAQTLKLQAEGDEYDNYPQLGGKSKVVYYNEAQNIYVNNLKDTIPIEVSCDTKMGSVTKLPETFLIAHTEQTITATPKEHYSFVRWCRLNTFWPTEYYSTPEITFTVTRMDTFYAEFAPDEYKITYETDGGILMGGNEDKYEFGSSFILPTGSEIRKDDCTFAGWYDNSSFTGSPITEIAANEFGEKTFYAKWIDGVVKKENIGTGADSGYYSATEDSEDRTGIISFNTMFDKYSELGDRVNSYGIYIYEDETMEKCELFYKQNDDGELAANNGCFYATVDEIPKENFSNKIKALPFIVVDGEVYTGEEYTTSVDEANATLKWLGKKPTATE